MNNKRIYDTEINLEFAVYSDNFDVKKLYNLMEIEHSYFYKAGDQIESQTYKGQYLPYTRKESSWLFSTGYNKTINFSIVEKQFLKIVLEKSKRLFEFIKEHNLHSKLYIILRIDITNPPIISMSRELVDFLHCSRSEIEFDNYYE